MQKPGFSKKPGFSSPPEQLQELAFGAYLGLAREQGGRAAEPQVIRVRQTALARLGELAVTPARQASVRLVLVQALSDPNQARSTSGVRPTDGPGHRPRSSWEPLPSVPATPTWASAVWRRWPAAVTPPRDRPCWKRPCERGPTNWRSRPPGCSAMRRGLVPVAGLALAAVEATSAASRGLAGRRVRARCRCPRPAAPGLAVAPSAGRRDRGAGAGSEERRGGVRYSGHSPENDQGRRAAVPAHRGPADPGRSPCRRGLPRSPRTGHRRQRPGRCAAVRGRRTAAGRRSWIASWR